jgi:hypothetical protein
MGVVVEEDKLRMFALSPGHPGALGSRMTREGPGVGPLGLLRLVAWSFNKIKGC